MAKLRIPVFYLVLDFIGVLFLALGGMALAGVDFGYPVLQRAAPGFIVLGLLLFVPLVVWIVRNARSQG